MTPRRIHADRWQYLHGSGLVQAGVVIESRWQEVKILATPLLVVLFVCALALGTHGRRKCRPRSMPCETTCVLWLSFNNGYTSYIEVLNAERSLLTAELLQAQTKGIIFQSLVNLYKAMGDRS